MNKLLIPLILLTASNLAYAEEYPCPPNTDVCADKDENGFCDEAEKEEEDAPEEDGPVDNEDIAVAGYTAVHPVVIRV